MVRSITHYSRLNSLLSSSIVPYMPSLYGRNNIRHYYFPETPLRDSKSLGPFIRSLHNIVSLRDYTLRKLTKLFSKCNLSLASNSAMNHLGVIDIRPSSESTSV
jgi:hypothetical protein